MDIYALFDHCQTRTREKRQIFTGNLLRAWEKFSGKMVNFTDAHGNIRQGLLTQRGFNAEAALEKMGVTMPTVEDAWRFLTEQGGQLKTGDKNLTIKSKRDGTFFLQTPKAKDSGGKYYLDEELLSVTGAEFFSVGDRMECLVDDVSLEAVLVFLMRERNYSLAAYEQREEARAMLGMALPSFAEVSLPTSPLPPLVSVDTSVSSGVAVDGAGAEQADPVVASFASEGRAEDEEIYTPTEAATVTLSEVCAWACAVRDLGLDPEQRQRRLKELTEALQAGEQPELSDYVRQQMQSDLEQYRPYQERGQALLESVRLLMASGGQLDIWGSLTFQHKRYECAQKGDTLTVQRRTGSKTSVILQAHGDDIQRTTVEEKDVAQFQHLALGLHLHYVQRFQMDSRGN